MVRPGFKARLTKLTPKVDPMDEYRDLKWLLFEEEWDALDQPTKARYEAAPFKVIIIGTYKGGPQ